MWRKKNSKSHWLLRADLKFRYLRKPALAHCLDNHKYYCCWFLYCICCLSVCLSVAIVRLPTACDLCRCQYLPNTFEPFRNFAYNCRQQQQQIYIFTYIYVNMWLYKSLLLFYLFFVFLFLLFPLSLCQLFRIGNACYTFYSISISYSALFIYSYLIIYTLLCQTPALPQ